jgi:hypothetical protein
MPSFAGKNIEAEDIGLRKVSHIQENNYCMLSLIFRN